MRLPRFLKNPFLLIGQGFLLGGLLMAGLAGETPAPSGSAIPAGSMLDTVSARI